MKGSVFLKMEECRMSWSFEWMTVLFRTACKIIGGNEAVFVFDLGIRNLKWGQISVLFWVDADPI